MFRTICDLILPDPDYPPRTRELDILQRALNGTLYDVLPYEFHDERAPGGDYIPLRNRRPSVRYALPRIVVEDSVALLFSEGHFPALDCDDSEVRLALAAIANATKLNCIMTEAALRGSVGSVAILLRVLGRRMFLEVLDTLYLTPVWDRHAPDTLLRVTERRKVAGRVLAAEGYDGLNADTQYWFTRIWDATWESWFVPQPVGGSATPELDFDRSARHDLGFVPLVWIRNLPGGTGDDGTCTFRAALETSIEIDYQLSQAGRGLKYSSDPTLLIKEPAGLEGQMVRGAANALVVSEKGDAKLLEIGGTASQAVIDYVRTLRELALESIHGNRTDASRLSAPASGRALELMNQGLLWLADNLRTSYGEGGLIPLARLMLRAGAKYGLCMNGIDLSRCADPPQLRLRWPDWYPSDASDRARDAQTLIALVNAKQLSRETALRVIAMEYGLTDVSGELARIENEAMA